MHSLKSLAFAATATATRTPVRPLDVAPAVRGLITASALKFLENTPVGQAGREAFRFRGTDGGNGRQLMMDSIDALARKGLVRRDAAAAAPGQRQHGTVAEAQPAGGRLQSQDVARRCAEHGPVRLVLPHVAQAKDGSAGSREFVVLATFASPEGRTVGVVLDGNDRQCNAVMEQLRDWMTAREDVRELRELTWQDFEAFDASRRDSGGTERVHQMAFRFVDLDDLLQAQEAPLTRYRSVADRVAPAAQRALLLSDRQVKTVGPLLSRADEAGLQDLVKRDPSLVERFSRPS